MREDALDRISEELKKSAPTIPPEVSRRFDSTLKELTSGKRSFRRRRRWQPVFASAVTAFVLVFFLLPNVSADVSYAMQDLPVIGDIIRITSVYKKQTGDEYHFEDIQAPELEGSGQMQEPVESINEDVDALVSRVMTEYENGIADIPDAHTGLMIDYEILTNNEHWFTMKLMIYHAAGSSAVEYHFYHIDKDNGQLVTLSDLFDKDFDYVSIFSEEVKNQMRQRMAADENQAYWIHGEEEYDWGLDRIDPDQNFYFDADGNLVLVFEKYEVAPGYMGTPEFTIPKEIFNEKMVLP